MFQTIGICLAIIAFAIGVMTRRELGGNWAHASDYQIKKKHELITTGVYRYIRHPIYTSISLFIVGCELVALSYLFLPLLLIVFAASYIQAKKEEKILLDHFGNTYKAYMMHSSMLLPYIFDKTFCQSSKNCESALSASSELIISSSLPDGKISPVRMRWRVLELSTNCNTSFSSSSSSK